MTTNDNVTPIGVVLTHDQADRLLRSLLNQWASAAPDDVIEALMLQVPSSYKIRDEQDLSATLHSGYFDPEHGHAPRSHDLAEYVRLTREMLTTRYPLARTHDEAMEQLVASWHRWQRKIEHERAELAAHLAVECPTCAADEGKRCRNAKGKSAGKYVHAARRHLAEGVAS